MSHALMLNGILFYAHNQFLKQVTKLLYHVANSFISSNGHRIEKKKITCSTIEVLMYQGATALLLMLSFAHSQARFLVSWLIAPTNHKKQTNLQNFINSSPSPSPYWIRRLPFVAPWTDIDFSETKPETEDIKTTLPTPDALRSGYASWHIWKVDPKLVSMSLENSAAVKSIIGFRMFVPTLFIYTSN